MRICLQRRFSQCFPHSKPWSGFAPPKPGGRGGVHSKNHEIEHLWEEEDEESVWLGTAEPSAASPFCVCVRAHSHASVQMHLEVRS